MKRTILLDSLLVLLLASVLIWPLFRLEYLDNWPSIESTFISDARMLADHLPHPGWQPLWYCGTRFDYVYPPALRYGPALISKAAHVSTARAYHLYVAFFYIFGIVAVYWMVMAGSRSRIAAWIAAAGSALLSPSFLLLPAIRHDSGYWVPQRLHALMTYGEGPHISALSVLPAALALTFLALRRWRPGALAGAGVLCALAVANNFYGATALAIFFPIMVWAVWTDERDLRLWLRAAGIAALAYGLSAFWLTPSYLRITAIDLKWVSQPGNAWSMLLLAIVLILLGAASLRWGRGRPDRTWSIFVAVSAVVLTLDLFGYYYFGFRVAGDTPRLAPELDLAMLLAFAEIIRILWKRPRWRVPAAVIVVLAFAPSERYLRHVWSPFPKSEPVETRYEHQIAKWVHDNLPGQRVLPSGAVRFWFDAWYDNAQMDGGSMQGMLNQNIPMVTWQILHGTQPEPSILWMQSLGTDAIIVPDQKAREHYLDYAQPHKFRGVLPVLFDDSQGTVIYHIPRVHPGIGRVVDRQAIEAIGKIRGGDDTETLSRYVAVIENRNEPAATLTWRGFDEMGIQTITGKGQSVLVQETFDSAWRASEGGRELAIRPEPVMDFVLIDVPPGNHAISLRFTVPAEVRAGRILLLLSLGAVAMLGWLAFRLKNAPRVNPV